MGHARTPTRIARGLAALAIGLTAARSAHADDAAPKPPSFPAPVEANAGTPVAKSGAFPDEQSMKKADGTEAYFYRTNFVAPGELVQSVTTLLAIPGVTMKDLPRQNQVVLQGTREAIETALDAFAYFDVPDPQVFVEAKIVEFTYDSNFEFGFSSSLDRDQGKGPPTLWRGGTATLNPPSFFQSQQPGNLPFQGASLAFGFVGKLAKEFGEFDLTFQALQRDGTAEVLSRPSIVATQGKLATVKTSQKVPIIQVQQASSSNATGEVLTLNSTSVDTKIGLDILPSLIGDGYVTMKVDPVVSDVTGFSQGPGGTAAPIISERSASTTVTMADGDTLIIGGLYTSTTISDKAKVPFLSDIPGLGALFTRTKDQKVKTELVFFITPHVLRKKSDYKVIVPPGEAERLRGASEAPCAPPSGANPGR